VTLQKICAAFEDFAIFASFYGFGTEISHGFSTLGEHMASH